MEIKCPCCSENFNVGVDILTDTKNDQITAIEITPQAGAYLSAEEVAGSIKNWSALLKSCAKSCGFNFSHSVVTRIETNENNAIKIYFLSVFKDNKPIQAELSLTTPANKTRDGE